MEANTRDRIKKAAAQAAERLSKREDFYTDKQEAADLRAVLVEQLASFDDYKAACCELPAADQGEINRTYQALADAHKLALAALTPKAQPSQKGTIFDEPRRSEEGTSPLVPESELAESTRPDAS